MLLGEDGNTITRYGRQLMIHAYQLWSAVERQQKRQEDYMRSYWARQLKRYEEQRDAELKKVRPWRDKAVRAARKLGEGLKAQGGLLQSEISDFFIEPAMPPPLQATLKSATAEFDAAKAALQELPVEV